jgi:hypothetical protein
VDLAASDRLERRLLLPEDLLAVLGWQRDDMKV